MTIVPPSEKILTRAYACERFSRPRNQRLVFTNGCFDILHRGHVEYLYAARNLGDLLVLGLNSDASVQRLKGPERPLVPQNDRALVLAGLACVDAVVIFDEDTPAELIADLVPDTLVKGGDYAVHEIVGRETVQQAGGDVVVIPFLAGHSTSSIVERIRQGNPA